MLNVSEKEKQRLEVVKSYQIINTAAKQDFDELARLASIVCDVPIVLISLMDDCTQHFLAHHGVDLEEVPREETFCQFLLENEPYEPLIIGDTLQDSRFSSNKYVQNEPNIRFYAGFPLITKDNFLIGSLCIIDRVPRELTPKQYEAISCLINQTLQIVELQKNKFDLEKSKKLHKLNANRLSNIIEAANVATWEWDLKTNYLKYNDKFFEIIGRDEKELGNTSLERMQKELHPEDLQRALVKLNDYFDGITDFYTGEYRIKHKNGSWVWILDRGSVVREDHEGNPLVMSGTITDITRRKIASERLTLSNKRLKLAQKIAKLGYWEVDKKDHSFYCSEQVYAILELEFYSQELSFDRMMEFIHPDDQSVVKPYYHDDSFELEADFEFRIITATGKTKWIYASRLIDTDDTSIIEGTLQDITSQKALKISLEESELRYTNLFQLMPIPSWIYDLRTLKIIEVNQAAIREYGYSRAEFLEKTIKELRPADEIPKLLDVVEDTRRNMGANKVGVYTHQRKNQSEFTVEIHSNQLKKSNQLSRVVMAINVSERYQYIKQIEGRNATLQEIARIQSHVVRAPLAKLMGIIQLIQSDLNLGAEEHAFFLNELLGAAHELDTVVREIAAKASLVETIQSN